MWWIMADMSVFVRVERLSDPWTPRIRCLSFGGRLGGDILSIMGIAICQTFLAKVHSANMCSWEAGELVEGQ